MPELRASHDGDEAGIRRLFEICHQRPLESDVWRWRYAKRAIGAAVTVVAEDAGEIVGHVSCLPVRLESGTRSVSAGLWVDLMVAPRFRNLTLFLNMADHNRRLCAERGVEMIFAFPNAKSFPVLKRMLDWKDAGDILALEGPLASVKRPEADGARVSPIDSFGPEFEEVWPRLRPTDRWCDARGAERLNWRYRSRPRARYPAWASRDAAGKIDGWLTAKTFDSPRGRVGDILDFWAAPQSRAANGLLATVLGFFQRENVAVVSAWALEGTAQRTELKNCGLAASDDRTHFVGRWTAEHGPEFPARHADWTLFKGDSDVF